MEREHFITFLSCMSDVTTKIASNEESFKKIKSNLDTMIQTIPKLDTKLANQKEIYFIQQKDINKYISDIASHGQNNKVIHF
eukprot:4946605-Ditylum_brightwellii.AAC.1